MKKLISACLALILTMMISADVFAAGATFSASASSKTLNKGQQVTITVNVSCGEEATSYGLMLSYDSSVFEFVSGNCTVAGTLVSSFNNGFAFMFQNPTAYSGKVGTVTLKVKESANLGTFTISSTASVKNGSAAVSATGCSVKLSIECKHSFGGWSKVNDDTHKRVCSICKKEENVKHSWDKGTVITKATCTTDGETSYTCTACGATKKVVVGKTDKHSFNSWSKVNDSTHKHSCTVCGKEETANHTWDKGVVSKKPNCQQTGIKTYTCTGCKFTKTETMDKVSTHTYDHGCDNDCNVCGFTRTTTHKYKTAWSKDGINHWHECSECKDKKDIAAHTPGAAATETTAQTCTVCQYEMQAALGHQHKHDGNLLNDATGHWYKCKECGEKAEFAAHIYDSDCDTDCSACGYIRKTEHTFDSVWSSDETGHWHACTECDARQDEAAHTPGEAATETTSQNCTTCGYVIAPALQPEKDFPWAVVIAALIGAGVGFVGGVTVAPYIKKKDQ